MDTRQETIKKIKSLLRVHRNGLTISDIAQKLRLNRNSTAKYLEILLISGEVKLNTFGPAKVYTFSQKMPISAMLKFSADIILLIDNEMCVLDANENALSILGMSREDLVGNLVENVKSPLLARLAIPDVLEEIQTNGEIQREFSIIRENEDHHYRVRLIPTVFDNFDEGITIIGEDITKQIRFEESLMISEARYRAIVEDQNEFICRFEPGGRLTFVNDAYCRYFGLHKEKCIGHRHTMELPPDDARVVKIHMASLTPENPVKTIEHRILMPDGTIAWHFWSDRAIFDSGRKVIEYLSVGRDITKRKVAEEALFKSEQLYRTILDNIRDVYYRCTVDGTLVMVSPSATTLFGYDSIEEIIGQNIAEKFYQSLEDREKFLEIFHREQEVTDYEILLKKRDGKHIVVSTNSHILRDSAGNATGIEGVLRDITIRKQAEKALHTSEERFHMITDHSPFPISIIDGSGHYLYINKIFTQLFGYTLDDIPTEKDWLSMAFPDISLRKEAMLTWEKDPAQSIAHEVSPCVFPVACKDGTVCHINFLRATLQSGERFIVYEDLTPKKESERLHSVLASIVNSSNDAITLYRSLNSSSPHQR
ncbi:MAG: PAS domain S-box protein [Methanoregula sp.]|jgi:PAS domain S-box-containing protein|nr:PAS domain S-box protein [Methanoregula sp.]